MAASEEMEQAGNEGYTDDHMGAIFKEGFSFSGYERDLLMRPDAEPGRYDMRYKISLYGMLGEKYYVRLFVGEEMRNEFTLVIKDS